MLAARSDVFRAMFAHDMKERQQGVVLLEDTEPDVRPISSITIMSLLLNLCSKCWNYTDYQLLMCTSCVNCRL